MANRLKLSPQSLFCLSKAIVALAVATAFGDGAFAQNSSKNDLPVICRAAVAAMMGHDISIVKLDKLEGEIAYVYYNRPSDGQLWKNRCRVESDKIIWSTVDAFGPGSGFGRWRNNPADEIVTYSLESRQITILQTFSDGSKITKSFAVRP